MAKVPKKGTLARWKYDAWELLSKAIRSEKPSCEVCGHPSTQVHHIIPRSRGNNVYFLERNLLSLCGGCHMGFHKRWSPEEIVEKIHQTKGDFSDVEAVKWDILQISVCDYEDMIEEYKRRIDNEIS